MRKASYGFLVNVSKRLLHTKKNRSFISGEPYTLRGVRTVRRGVRTRLLYYGFRLAEPGLFIAKYEQFASAPTDTGMRIDLNANFRSRKEILQATNFIFSQIMGKDVGDVNYDDNAALHVGATYDEITVPVELAIIEQDNEDADDTLTKQDQEAHYIVQRIQQLMREETMVFDTKTNTKRPLTYRDIVIITRSMTWSNELVEAFKQANIPLYAETPGGYFESLEVMVMMNTLKCIDNPYQDIALASVLRAPFIGLTENELAHIRLANKKTSYYDALQAFISQEQSGIAPQTARKLTTFFVNFEKWRQLSRRGSLADLIWQVYNDTNYYDMVGAMANGKQRQANLRALHERALAYEKTSFRGLFRFLRFVDRMRLRGDDLSSARAIGAQEDVVRLMTIHSSKGLEFPVVFVAALGKGFNQKDLQNAYLFDQHYGLAVKAVDPEERIMFEALPYVALSEKKRLEIRSEEMRILYVAMTRAKERLILVGSVKKYEQAMAKWCEAQHVKTPLLPTYLRASAKTYLDWIVPAVARHHQFTLGEAGDRVDPSIWQMTSVTITAREQIESEAQEKAFDQQAYDAYTEVLHERFGYRYAYERATRKRTKTSVTEQKRLRTLAEQEETFTPIYTNTQSAKAERPKFMQAKTLSAGELGTAVHTIMQHVPQQGVHSEEEALTLISSLYQRELLTATEKDAVEPQWITAFFATPLGKTFMEAKRILREQPFTWRVVDSDGDAQILQGIVDVIVEEADGSYSIIDYKTDNVSNDVEAEMKKRHAQQLTIYRQALEAILGITISHVYVYAVRTQQAIRI